MTSSSSSTTSAGTRPTADDVAAVRQQFARVFGPGGGKVHVVRAPGRVNLIGEHTDYNDGFVFPMAIEPHVLIAFRGRGDQTVRLATTLFPGEVAEFSLDAIARGEPTWANYSKGAAAMLKGAGFTLTGMDALLTNTLPVGGGLSSSAALEVGTARALLALLAQDIDLDRLALLMQRAEHEYALVPVGIMDMMTIAAGRAGHAMLLDCRDLSKRFVPLDGNELRVVIVNSMVRHELSGGEYAERRRQCEQGVAHFRESDPNVKALRDVAMKQVLDARGALGDVVFRRCRHVVGENARATEYATLLTQRKYDEAGVLMVQSHNSLRDDYEVSVPELDYLVEQAMTVKGAYGARMTGGGFGGCIVALCQPRAVDALRDHLTRVYPERFDKTPDVIVTTATAGAAVVE